jgi:hypothetical protein
MYRAYGLLQPNTSFTLEKGALQLAARFPDATVSREGDRIRLIKGEWQIELAIADGPQVQSEAEGFAGKIAGLEPQEAAAIASCSQRIEVDSDVPDPFMEHFNDFLTVVEVLKSFPGVIVIDPKEPALL